VKGLKMVRFLKYGITTGASAAAAAKAAVIALISNPVERVVIPTPIGIRFEIPVKESKKLSNNAAVATVVKDAGDDIDATDKIEITATVKLTTDGKVTIKSGEGIGKVTKPGLAVPIGESAINPVPRKMIHDAVKEALPRGKGVQVIIAIPEGEARHYWRHLCFRHHGCGEAFVDGSVQALVGSSNRCCACQWL
jgi:cobalt-precorrin-5B (C1)-methyltransferase